MDTAVCIGEGQCNTLVHSPLISNTGPIDVRHLPVFIGARVTNTTWYNPFLCFEKAQVFGVLQRWRRYLQSIPPEEVAFLVARLQQLAHAAPSPLNLGISQKYNKHSTIPSPP